MSNWSDYGIHKGLFLWPSLWVFTAWAVFGFEQAAEVHLGAYGLLPRSAEQWYGVLTLPWLHGDLNHITSNTISLFFVGVLLRYTFPRLFDRVWLLSLILPGVMLWFIGRPSIHIGASAWLYALVSFIFFSGVLRGHIKLLAQSMLMVFLYGSFVWGILPHDPTISYEGHLSGAFVGMVLAVVFRNAEPIEPLRDTPLVHEEVEWEDWKDPAERELDFEEVSPSEHTPKPPQKGPQFRYGDGSSPDQWV